MLFQKMKDNQIFKKLASLVLVFVMAIVHLIPIFALTQGGTGGRVYTGAGTNTFAASMPLAEIYFVESVFNNFPKEITITDNTSNALALDGYDVVILGSALKHNTADNNLTGSYELIYENGAILPDGTKKDVKVTLELGRVLTTKSGDAGMPDETVIFRSMHATNPGLNFIIKKGGATTDGKFGIAVEQFVTFNVDGDGDFVLPFYGITQNRNFADSYSIFRENFPDNNVGYDAAIETVKIKGADQVYTATPGKIDQAGTNHNYITVENDVFTIRGGTAENYDPSGPKGDGGSDDAGYEWGFAAFASTGFTASISSPTSSNTNREYGNNQFIIPGDLIHRIWSGSGTGGTIKVDKRDSAGTVLDGGTFKGFTLPTGMPESNTDDLKLMRYVIPDAKEGVTYRITPDKGYALDKVAVDGTVITMPKDVVPGRTWDTAPSTDGGGELTHNGDGKFTYVFHNANTQDHSIYVTWKKTRADIIVNKIWKDDSKAAGVSALVRLVSDAEEDPVNDTQDVPTTSGEVHKWEDMLVFNYDENGAATTPITYTLSEESDPVSSDYIKAVWSGSDYESGTPDGGFTLTDPNLPGKSRVKNDPFKATVTNILAKSVEITKVWDDQSNKYKLRPSDVASLFKLYNANDDTEIKDVTPVLEKIDKNTDMVKWDGLPAFNENGDSITYYAKETTPKNYQSDSSDGKVEEGGTITNKCTYTPTPKPTDPPKKVVIANRVDVPDTGDDSDILMWSMIFVLSFVSASYILRTKISK